MTRIILQVMYPLYEINNKQVREAVNTLGDYIERCNDIVDHVFGSLFNLKKTID